LPTRKAVRTAATAAGLLVLGVVCFVGAKSLVEGESAPDQQAVEPTRTSTDSSGTSTDTLPPPSLPSPTRPVEQCRNTQLSPGLALLEPTIAALHDAACRGDFDALLSHMSDPFGSQQVPKEEAVSVWTAELPGGDPLGLLAETLETPVHGDQGGQFFCHPKGAVAVFARPLNDQPSLLTDFDPSPGSPLADSCRTTP
jgi:hypothetical protein